MGEQQEMEMECCQSSVVCLVEAKKNELLVGCFFGAGLLYPPPNVRCSHARPVRRALHYLGGWQAATLGCRWFVSSGCFSALVSRAMAHPELLKTHGPSRLYC